MLILQKALDKEKNLKESCSGSETKITIYQMPNWNGHSL
jgi:hypothetical protein